VLTDSADLITPSFSPDAPEEASTAKPRSVWRTREIGAARRPAQTPVHQGRRPRPLIGLRGFYPKNRKITSADVFAYATGMNVWTGSRGPTRLA
jgi:hypothetical protein